MTKKQERIAGLDLVKGLGLVLVIYYHITWQYPPDILTSRVPLDYVMYWLQTFLSCCVPLFFMVSGALSLTRPAKLKKNCLRCLHLLLITVVWVIICLVVVLWLKGERVSQGEFLRMGRDLRVGYIQHLWYLPNFIFLSLMAPVLYILKSGDRRVYWFFIGLIGLFSFGNTLCNDGEYFLRWVLGKTGYTGYRYWFWYVDYFAYHYWYSFVYFALGAWVVENREKLATKRRLLIAGIPLSMTALFLLALATSRVKGWVYDPVFNNYSSIFTLIITFCLFSLLVDRKPPKALSTVTASLSECSLGIYIIHWLIWGGFVRLMPEVMKNVTIAWPMTVVILAISWGITWLGLRIPLVKNFFTAAPAWIRKF